MKIFGATLRLTCIEDGLAYPSAEEFREQIAEAVRTMGALELEDGNIMEWDTEAVQIDIYEVSRDGDALSPECHRSTDNSLV